MAFYIQKHITPCTVVITSLLVRDKPLGASASVKRVTSRNRVTYCFWSVSGAAVAAILPTLFNFLEKKTEAKFFLKVHMVNLWVWEKNLVPILVTLGQGHQAYRAGQILPCPNDNERTAHPIATKLGRYISLVMLST